MKKSLLFIIVIIISTAVLLPGQKKFSPEKDGWYFENWGEQGANCIGSCDFSWDLFKRTYLGIYPTKNCAAAPLDCAFYETFFKDCAKDGNCGGMSVLALALFKYGGYLGFCSPANFYTGTNGPDREDLHRALNMIQARQFSISGITRFIHASNNGTLNDAEVAFENVKELMGRGDYPVIWIAKDNVGEAAHTVIPYKVSESGGQKIMYIWDPNNPYNFFPDRYDLDIENRLIINGPQNWSYSSGNSDSDNGPTTYSGDGWCLCIPMSDIMKKSRQPMAVEIANDIIELLFVNGPGAAVSQISDDKGRRFYKNDNDVHTKYSEIETDPDKRLKGAIRWPWIGKESGELYFIRSNSAKVPDLKVTFSGKNYKAMYCASGNLIEIESRSLQKTRDIVKLSKIASYQQSIEIKTSSNQKEFDIKQLRTDLKQKNYRSFFVKNLKIDSNITNVPITIDIVGDFEAVEVSSQEKKIDFDFDIMQKKAGKISSRQIKKLSTVPGKLFMISPKNWEKLESTEMEKTMRTRPKKKREEEKLNE